LPDRSQKQGSFPKRLGRVRLRIENYFPCPRVQIIYYAVSRWYTMLTRLSLASPDLPRRYGSTPPNLTSITKTRSTSILGVNGFIKVKKEVSKLNLSSSSSLHLLWEPHHHERKSTAIPIVNLWKQEVLHLATQHEYPCSLLATSGMKITKSVMQSNKNNWKVEKVFIIRVTAHKSLKVLTNFLATIKDSLTTTTVLTWGK
jgi:hypothetical protein